MTRRKESWHVGLEERKRRNEGDKNKRKERVRRKRRHAEREMKLREKGKMHATETGAKKDQGNEKKQII